MRGFFCRILCAIFGLGFMAGSRRARWGGRMWAARDRDGECEGHRHHHHGGGMLGADPEKRRRFRRRLREALDDLLADEPEHPEQGPGQAQGQPTA